MPQRLSNRSCLRLTAYRPLMATLALVLLAISAQAADTKKPAESDDSAIRATAKEFVAAFNHGDAKAIAALWTVDGTLVDDRGQLFKGRKAIEDVYAAFFKADPGVRIEVAVQSIEFPSPTTAIEDGISQSLTKDGAATSAGRYTAIHVQQDGKWLMASVRESSIDVAPKRPQLQELQWLVGTWQAKSERALVRASFRWIAGGSYLQREYTVRQDGIVTSSGVQIIGWDPQSGRIQAWSFDSSGGHGTSYWTATPDGWTLDSKGVLANGTPTSSKDFLIRVPGESKVLGWRSTNRKAGPLELPDLREVVLDRLPEKR